MRSFIRKILSPPQTDTEKLLSEAVTYERYRDHEFNFRGMKLNVTDFISVAWQLKEFFDDGRMKFNSDTDSPVIYDCGANVGISILFYKKLYPKAVIKAFEPDPNILKCLKKNLIQNKITDVSLIEKAVWINNDGVSFGSEGADGGSLFYEGNKTLLPSVRLKELIKEEISIDLLKMDIEGAELDVLMDCKEELKKIKYLFVEYHSWEQNTQKLDLLLQTLTNSGFRYYIHSIGNVLKQPFIVQKSSNGIDVQLDIHAINGRIGK